MQTTTEHPTVILGGGFTGLFTALHLSNQNYAKPTILIDRESRFIFKPLLYEFFSGEMKQDVVWPSYDELLADSGVSFFQDSVQEIDLKQKQVKLASGTNYTYGNLVLALGSTNSYFGIKGASENTIPFRTAQDAIVLEKQLRECLKRAVQSPDAQSGTLTVAVLGAGRSGVELAATLADVLPEWYTDLGGDAKDIKVVVIQRGAEILKGDSDNIRQTAENALKARKIPVELILEAEITAVVPGKVEFQRHGETETIAAETIVWTAGVGTHELIKSLPVAAEYRDKQGRLIVTPTLQLPEYPEVFAGGDCAVEKDSSLPPTAQVAYQQGSAIATNLKALSEGDTPTPASVFLRGTLLKLGLEESAASIFDLFEVKGKIGHMIRQATYLGLIPKPAYTFKATTEWLTDEVFRNLLPI